MASVWNLVALSVLKIRRIKAVLLHPSDKAYCSCPNGNRDRLTAIRPQTDFSIHKNRARCVLSNKKCDCNLLNNRFLKKKSITMGNDIETSELL